MRVDGPTEGDHTETMTCLGLGVAGLRVKEEVIFQEGPRNGTAIKGSEEPMKKSSAG